MEHSMGVMAPPIKIEPLCVNCAHWEYSRHEFPPERGECRRNAPALGPDRSPLFPLTSHRVSCGEHKPVETW